MERIAFFVSSPFHGAMLDPILECCRKSHFECLRSDGLAEIARFQPRAVFHASKIDRDFRREFPETFHIWVRHGFASKNFGKQSVARADIACMPSLWSLMEYRRRGLRPRLDFWVTGFSALDVTFRSLSQPRKGSSGPVMLYAPTFDAELSAHPVLGTRWLEACLERVSGLRILIKPHPHIPMLYPDWMLAWENLAATSPGVEILAPDSNFYEIMGESDLLLSDCSSVFLYYSLLDRPLVLVSNPERFASPKFDPRGPEWIFRGSGVDVQSGDMLPAAVRACLEDPGRWKSARQALAWKVAGETFDGRSSERIVAGLAELLSDSRKMAPGWLGRARKRTLLDKLEGKALRFFPRFGLSRYKKRESRS